LWQVLLIYVGGALVAYQAVQALTEGLGLPQWFPALAIVLFIIGLPIVLATAFVHEVSPPLVTPAEPTPLTDAEAARIEAETATARLEARRRHRFLTWRSAGLAFLSAFAVWGVVAAGWMLLGGRADGMDEDRKSVAVLPFVNLSGDPDNEYFSDGITGDIINRLSKIADLKVISRTSVMQYKGTGKNLRQIGQELDVSTVLEGEVQRAGDRVRINAQLIDAETDEHIWAEQYNRQMADIFDIQSDVAERIAAALEATLTDAEKDWIERKPTENQEAYEYYLRGKAYENRSQLEQDIRVAIQMYQKAVELDPNFAVAFARLSEQHSRMYWFYYDRTEERLAQAKRAVDTSFRLVPQLPEAHRAMGFYYYWGHLDYDRALEQFEIARESQPNSADILAGIGWVRRRQGKFDQALLNLEKAVELDPRSANLANNLGQTYGLVRRYPEAVRHMDRAVALTPEWPRPYAWTTQYTLNQYGSTQEALAVLERASLIVDDEADPYFARASVLYRAFDGRFQEAIARLDLLAEETLETQFWFVPKSLLAAQVYSWTNQPETARTYYETARAILERKLQEMPDDHRARGSLGIAYAGLGRKEDAIREGKLAVELMPVSKEAWKGVWRIEDLARIHAMVGEADAAIDQLDFLLSVPGELSVNLLRVDPSWNPLRNHPRFQALLERYE
jgi:serine/threonine-protein kinase